MSVELTVADTSADKLKACRLTRRDYSERAVRLLAHNKAPKSALLLIHYARIHGQIR